VIKTMAAVVVLMVLGATSAAAVDIDGKWGIGAGVFGGGGEVSLIRGHSDRTAWLFDVELGGNNTDFKDTQPGLPAQTSSRNVFDIAAGPGLRRFTRPQAEYSPYFDVRLRARYNREHDSVITGTTLTTSTSLALGVEYSTRWHFSVAAHSSVADIAWSRSRVTYYGADFRRATDWSAAIALHPAIFVRGYF
jgi:hypothetical protein